MFESHKKHNTQGPLGHVPVLPSTLAAPLCPTPIFPTRTSSSLTRPPPFLPIFYTLPSSNLPGKESLHRSLLTLSALQSCKTLSPVFPFPAPQTTPLLLPHTRPPRPFLFALFHRGPLLSEQREKVGREGRRKEKEEVRIERGECALSALWAGLVLPHQGVEIPLQLPAFSPSLSLFTPLTHLCHIFSWHHVPFYFSTLRMTLHQACLGNQNTGGFSFVPEFV